MTASPLRSPSPAPTLRGSSPHVVPYRPSHSRAHRDHSRVVPRAAAPCRLAEMGAVMVGFVVALALGWPTPGFAQVLDPELWVANGPVYTIVRDGGTVYIGGHFTQVGPATGGGAP